jgi:hypothetical protein
MGTASSRPAAPRLITVLAVLTLLSVQAPPAASPGIQGQAQPSGFLSPEDKEELREAIRLRESCGAQVWPGLERAEIPMILFDESSEFLIGLAAPGPAWTAVGGDDFEGHPYFRRPAPKPQAFAVPVDGTWAGSMSTLGRMNRRGPMRFARGFHLALLLHEMFHAFQAIQAPERFARAMKVYAAEAVYPFEEPDFIASWNKEGTLLAAALSAPDEAGACRSARDFLEARRLRRLRFSLGPDLLAFERELEWLEGLGKYAEVRFPEIAATRAGEPAQAALVPADPFKRMDAARLETQIGRQKGDLRFYLTGSAQARLLDRLDPGWKRTFSLAELVLEDALRDVVAEPSRKR